MFSFDLGFSRWRIASDHANIAPPKNHVNNYLNAGLCRTPDLELDDVLTIFAVTHRSNLKLDPAQ
jgi:hypothetical protein